MGQPTYVIYVDWEKNGTWVNESSYLASFVTRRGRRDTVRGRQYAQVGAGTFEGTFRNGSQRYNAWNSSSPLYGYILPKRPLRIQATYDGLTYNILTGWVNKTRQQDAQLIARLSGSDGIDWLEYAEAAPGELQSDYLVDAALNDLVSGAGWPYMGSSGWVLGTSELGVDTYLGADLSDSGTDELVYWWPDTRISVWRNAELIAETVAGDVYIAADGTIAFRSRNESRPILYNLTGGMILRDIEQQQPGDEIRNDVRVTAYPLQEFSSVELWRLNDKPMIQAGETLTIYARYQYDSRACAASTVTTPVSTTDYTANTAQDGSGTNKTAQISITMTDYGDVAELAIENTDAADVYLTLMKLRGTALANLSGVTAVSVDASSQSDYEVQSLIVDTPWTQQAVDAQNHADHACGLFAEPRRPLFVRIIGQPALQFAPDLFDEITFEDDVWGIAQTRYKITYIEHNYDVRRGTVTTFRLEPLVESGYWVLGESALDTETILGW